MSEKKQVNFTVVPDEAPEVPRIYSNFCGIQHSPFDFTLTFCEMPPIGERELIAAQESNVVRAPVRSRLVVPIQMIPGLVAALQVIAIMVSEQKALSELAHVMERVPQVLESIKLPSRRPLEQMLGLTSRISASEKKLGRDGRVLVRWSGTEAKLRIMVEGPDLKVLWALVDDMADAARKDTAAT